jgi:hypothetical protein
MDCASVQRDWWAQGCEAVVQAHRDEIEKPTTSLAGGVCLSDIHCKVGMRCEGARPECAGTCVPEAEEGEPCRDLSECRFELICSGDHVCERPRSAGSTCRNSFDCEQDCVRNLCVDTADLLLQGCVEQSDCGVTLRCRDGRCAQRGGVDARCELESDCYPGLACMSGRCALTAACRAGERGDPCMDSVQCKRELTCNTAERRCVESPRHGDGCSVDLLCAPGDQCRPTKDLQGVCEASPSLADEGDDCSAFWECKSGFCADGKCAQPVACE